MPASIQNATVEDFFDTVSEPEPAQLPKFLRDEPSRYLIEMVFNSSVEEGLEMSREEYIALKRHLAGIRGVEPVKGALGLAPPSPHASMLRKAGWKGVA